MESRRLHVVGHFGTRFSYATVAANICRALRSDGLLGHVHNLDAAWHESFSDLQMDEQPCSHVLLFTAPNDYFGIYAERYGRRCSAIYASPNTAELADEHARLMSQFGLVLAPSSYCAETVRAHVDSEAVVLPLGVDAMYAEGRDARIARLTERVNEPPTFVHLSSDQSWPGRKGTEELVEAWEIATREFGCGGHLVLHVPASLYNGVEMMCRDAGRGRRDFLDRIEVRKAADKGSSPEELLALYDEADVMVLPSRCEGWGLMIQAALVAGVPMITTCASGQVDFLLGRAGAWLGVPTPFSGRIAYEQGSAPLIEPDILAACLAFASEAGVRRTMLSQMHFSVANDTWDAATREWVNTIRAWMQEETLT